MKKKLKNRKSKNIKIEERKRHRRRMTEVKKTYKITQSKTAKQSKTLVQIQLAKSPQDPGLNLARVKTS